MAERRIMSEHLDRTTIKQSLLDCAAELDTLQNSTGMSYTEVEQRHGRVDGRPVELHNRNGAPVLEKKKNDAHVWSESFVGSLGGVCMNCPVLDAGDGCALRDSFHQSTAEMRSKNEDIMYKAPMEVSTSPMKKSRKAAGRSASEDVTVTHMPEEQRAASEDPQAKEERVNQIIERSRARAEEVGAIYKARSSGYAYPGAATRHKEVRNELNQDHTDHIAADD